MRNAFVDELTGLAAADPDVVLITGDLGFGVFEDFEQRFPKQYLNAGVAEQNMTMLATGMALEGKKVYTYSIGNFPTLRCLEQIRNDICYHDASVTIVGMGGGFSYGQLGMSHHATEDLSILRALPGMTLVAPSSAHEVRAAMRALYHVRGPAYLRLDKSKLETDDADPAFELGKARTLRAGDDVTLIAAGGIMQEAWAAAQELERQGIDCRVLSMHTVKPIDRAAIEQASTQTAGIVTIEENNIIGGLGGAVAEICLESAHRPGFFRRIGLRDTYSSVVGDQKFLRASYGMDAQTISDAVLQALRDQRNETAV